MLIGLFRQRQFADERKWLFVSADVRGAGTRDEPLRTSAWEGVVPVSAGPGTSVAIGQYYEIKWR